MSDYPQDRIGKARMAKASGLAMRDRAATLAAQWVDGRHEKVRRALTPGPSEGAAAMAALIVRALHDNADDWRGFTDWLVSNAIATRHEIEAA